MSCLYALWDIVGMWNLHAFPTIEFSRPPLPDDTVARKVNSADASAFARICGCCPSQALSHICACTRILLTNELCPTVWGFIWLVIAFLFFAAGILVGLAVFKVSRVPVSSPFNRRTYS